MFKQKNALIVICAILVMFLVGCFVGGGFVAQRYKAKIQSIQKDYLEQELRNKEEWIKQTENNQTASQNIGIELAKKSEIQQERTKTLIKEVVKYEKIHVGCKPDANSVRAWNAANSAEGLSTKRNDHMPEVAAGE